MATHVYTSSLVDLSNFSTCPASSAYQRQLTWIGVCVVVYTAQKYVHRVSYFNVGIGDELHMPDASNHSLYQSKLHAPSYPKGKFGVHQLLDGPISLSPRHTNETNTLHAITNTRLHHEFHYLGTVQA